MGYLDCVIWIEGWNLDILNIICVYYVYVYFYMLWLYKWYVIYFFFKIWFKFLVKLIINMEDLFKEWVFGVYLFMIKSFVNLKLYIKCIWVVIV